MDDRLTNREYDRAVEIVLALKREGADFTLRNGRFAVKRIETLPEPLRESIRAEADLLARYLARSENGECAKCGCKTYALNAVYLRDVGQIFHLWHLPDGYSYLPCEGRVVRGRLLPTCAVCPAKSVL